MSDKLKKSVVLLHGTFDQALLGKVRGKKLRDVFVLEGRPSLISSKETIKQLLKGKVKPTLITDNMAGFLFFKKCVSEVWLTYQTSDRQGILSQIGGLVLAVLAKRHKVPVYVVQSGLNSKLMGDPREILRFNGKRVAPEGTRGYVPLVEWIPRKYISKVY